MKIQYNQTVAIQSTQYCNFISANGSARQTLCVTKPWLNINEQWKILLHSDTGSTANVKFGDIISFSNQAYNPAYLSGFNGYSAPELTTMDAMQDYERWQLVNPSDPSSTAEVSTCDEFQLLLVNGGTLSAQVTGDDIQPSIPLVTSGASTFRLIQTSVSS